MAGPRICHNAGGTLIDNSGTPVPTPAVSRPPTRASAQTPASAPVPGPPGRYTDVDLQRAIKLALELFVKGQLHGQANSAPRDRALKAQNLNFYYGSLDMECYYFC